MLARINHAVYKQSPHKPPLLNGSPALGLSTRHLLGVL